MAYRGGMYLFTAGREPQKPGCGFTLTRSSQNGGLEHCKHMLLLLEDFNYGNWGRCWAESHWIRHLTVNVWQITTRRVNDRVWLAVDAPVCFGSLYEPQGQLHAHKRVCHRW